MIGMAIKILAKLLNNGDLSMTLINSNFIGVIKWFDNAKGFGFAKPFVNGVIDHDHADVFVHHQAVIGDEFISMHAGEVFECELVETESGFKGENIQPIRNQFVK
jgi:CspA family cold shock protein